MINLEWFRTFKTVYDKGSMTEAAKALCMSQPGVSLHLSSLESHVGYRLFERMPRTLLPTERGKLLYNAVVDPLVRLGEVEARFQKTTRTDVPSLALGMCFEMFQLCLEKYVHTFGFNLILEFGEYPALLHKLEKNTLDLVVTPHKIETRGVRFRPFSRESIVLVAGKGTDTAAFAKLAVQKNVDDIHNWLTGQRWYGITGDNEHLRRFWLANFNRHPDFRPNYIVPNIHSIVRSLSSGPGLSVIPDFLCRKEVENGDLTLLWEGMTPLSNTLYFARRDTPLHPNEISQIEAILEKEMPAA